MNQLNYLEETKSSRAPQKRLRPREAPEEDSLQSTELPAGHTVCSRFPSLGAATHARMGFDAAAAFETSLLLSVTPLPYS